MPDTTAPAPSSDPPFPATVGRYEVVRPLGEGAMGRVLLAHDPVLDRDVAIKHLRGDLKIPRDVRQGLLARMRHEARAAARVAHPNLVVLHDMGEDKAVGLYLVFEYIEGPTLKQRLAKGRLSAAEAGRLARELGGALACAHEAGILHRDVKPENVMLARLGGKLADFGIARIPDSTLTHQGGLMGTPAYSAPETFRAGKFSALSDQFSLAASLYEAVSGRRAFPGEDAVTVAGRIANEPPERFAASLGLLPAVDDVLSRALDRNPDARFPTCEAFGTALESALCIPASAARGSAPSLAGASPGAGSLSGAARAVSPSVPLGIPETAAPPARPRLFQVVLGALIVLGTAALIVRAQILASERNDFSPVLPGVSSAQALGSAAARARPTASATARPPAYIPLVPTAHPVRPHTDASAEIRRTGPSLEIAPGSGVSTPGATADAGAAPAPPPAP